jgi:hypothetical protein
MARAKIALAFLAPAVRLAARRRQRPFGYLSQAFGPVMPPGALPLGWQGDGLEAPAGWWHAGRGTAPGVIQMAGLSAGLRAQPWERMLSASLAPEAAGRIEWIRIFSAAPARNSPSPGAPAEPAPVHGGPVPTRQVNVLQSPGAWNSGIGDMYSSVSGPSQPPSPAVAARDIQHVIGQAVATSAGPVMEVADTEAALRPSNVTRFLCIPELEEGSPQLVILQAIPSATELAGSALREDEPEKLALAAGLAEDGVPAILLLPVLPASLVPEVARAITAQRVAREGRGDAQRLLARLRKVIAPHVPPQVLDDIVLFLDQGRYLE